MNQPNLLDNTKIQVVKVSQASAGTAVVSDSVDMANYEGVVFVTSLGTANAGNSVNAAQSSNDSDFDDLAGTSQVPASNGDEVLVDIYRPRERYVRLEVDRSGANTTVESIIAILYGPRRSPQTSIATQETHVSPAEGTA